MNNLPPRPPPSAYIFSVTEFLDDQGRRVLHRSILCGTPPADYVEFVGVGQVTLEMGANGPRQSSQYSFAIQAATLDEAFARWDELNEWALNDHVNKVREQVMANQRRAAPGAGSLVVPGSEAAVKKILAGP